MLNIELLPIPRLLWVQIIRYLIRRRLVSETKKFSEQNAKFKFIEQLEENPLAVKTAAANQQHYEVPPAFYQLVLGTNLKYSSCYYESGASNLSSAEQAMLELYVERADLYDGQTVLELGCGWGSLSLYLARRFPNSFITAVSNSNPQRLYIESIIQKENICNLKIITADINNFVFEHQVDRIVSIEMFEHLRNYRKLFVNLRNWLKDNGQIFVHIFCHKNLIYFFEEQGPSNWMGRYFFSGGIMPAFDLFQSYSNILNVVESWQVNGKNYYLTALDWERNLLKNRSQILKIFEETYGIDCAELFFQRWRLFFIACQELFSFNQGQEWIVGHYLLKKAQNVQV